MTAKSLVKFTANFERNIKELDAFLVQAQAPHAFDALLDELTNTVIPNLETFPGMGRLFTQRAVRSVEVSNGMARLTQQLKAIAIDAELREYVLNHYLLLYARIKGVVYLLCIRHQKQLSFDFETLWSERN